MPHTKWSPRFVYEYTRERSGRVERFFIVRIVRDGALHQRVFTVTSERTRAEARRQALAFRDHVLALYPELKLPGTVRRYETVQYQNGAGNPGEYLSAKWQARLWDGRRSVTRSFSVEKYGEGEALRLAREALEELRVRAFRSLPRAQRAQALAVRGGAVPGSTGAAR